MNGVLLIGNLRSSLTLARELSRAGWSVHCGVDEPDPYLATSRHIQGWFEHATVDKGPDPVLGQVAGYLAAHPSISVIVPVSDNATRLFSAHRERFDGRVVLAVANRRAVENCIDKAAMFDLCERLSVPVAPRRLVRDQASLLAAIETVGFPCVVKPVDASEFIFGRKALVLRSPEEAAEALPHWPTLHDVICVQKFVGGFRHDVFFAAAHGVLLEAVDGRIVRNDTMDGTGYAVEIASETAAPFVREALHSLVKELDYHGVGALQFMIDPTTGEATFLELNPRLSACYRVAELSGLPLSRWIIEIAAGAAPAARPDPWAYPVGLGVAWVKGDLAGLKREWRKGALSLRQAACWTALLTRAIVRRHHLTLDPADLAPTLWIYLHPLLRRMGLNPGMRDPARSHWAIEVTREMATSSSTRPHSSTVSPSPELVASVRCTFSAQLRSGAVDMGRSKSGQRLQGAAPEVQG